MTFHSIYELVHERVNFGRCAALWSADIKIRIQNANVNKLDIDTLQRLMSVSRSQTARAHLFIFSEREIALFVVLLLITQHQYV